MPPSTAAETPPPGYLCRGTPEFRRAAGALIAAGVATFALLYCVQPMLPRFADEFGLHAASSSLALSATTAMLAFALLLAGPLSEMFGRAGPMRVSMFAAASLALACAFAPDWQSLLILRTLLGIALSGVPAVAIAYVAEEVEPAAVGTTMGLYVGSTAFGGMCGRVLGGLVLDVTDSWRMAAGAIGLLGFAAAASFAWLLPPSRHFIARRGISAGEHLRAYGTHLGDSGLRRLFASGFLLMGTFVTLYNYAGFHLMAEPFGLGEALVGALFLVYVVGIWSSPLFGRLANRHGRARMLGIGALLMLSGVTVTLAASLPVIVVGIAVATAGFFGGHAVASGWVGMRGGHAKAQAASLYLFFYYLGSSLVGALGGLAWSAAGWFGIVGFIAAQLVLLLLIARRLATRG